MKSLVFDVNVILDLWLERKSEAQLLHLAGLLESGTSNGYNCWVCSSSLHVLEYITRRELKKNGIDSLTAKQTTRQLLAELLKYVTVLSCFGFQQDEALVSHTDLEDAQIVRAASLINDPTAIVTNENRFDTSDTDILELKPSEAQDWLKESISSSIDFIDLKSQQDLIRPALEKKIHTVLHHGQYIMGPEVRELERRLAEYVGVQHCITCASGTDALLMALMALQIGPGDEVITVPYTWISSAEVIALLRAKPVFVDILPDTFNLDPDRLEAAITPRTKAIMPVSIFGQCPDMDRIKAIAEKYGIPVIEDAAQSFGATYKGRKSCALSTIGCTSFFPSKPLGGYGDGGALFTPDGELAETLRQIRVHGQKVKHEHPLVGLNGRLDTLQAAVLLPKLDIFPRELERRQAIAQRYSELLRPQSDALSRETVPEELPERGFTGISPPHLPQWGTSAWAQYTILAENRDRLSQHLKDAGIPSVAYYTTPLHLQEAFRNLGHQPGDFPVAEQVAAQCLSLPMSPYLSEGDQEKIANTLRAAAQDQDPRTETPQRL